MRRPLRPKNPRGQVTSVQSVPAPIGGWNAKNSIAAMPPQDAVSLVNWFPTTVDCELRGGYAAHGTVTGTVETLAVYNAMDGTNELYAVTDTDAYDVTSAGAGSAQTITVTDGKWQTLNFGDGTNNYLIMVNGVDAPQYYNGTSWTLITGVSSPALSGATLTDLVHVTEYQGRLYFLKNNSLEFEYLAAGAAGGPLTAFDLSSFANLGGYLMWAATWSFDGGDGMDDYIVFMTSQGEAIIYRGTDPSTAADWLRVGTYFLGKPLGRRSFAHYGGDLIALTQNGAYPMSSSLKTATIDERIALTDKIEKAFNDAANNYGSNFGWDVTLLPLKSALVFNIPIAVGGTHQQYVMNTITNSWCKFDSWNGECFTVFNDELYFGASGVVRKAWTGTIDLTNEIVAVGKSAFNYFGDASQLKRVTLFRPMLQVNGDIAFLTGLDVDFSDRSITGTASFSTSTAGAWGSATWGSGSWAFGLNTARKWTSPSYNVGYAFSGGVKVNADSLEVHWVACDYVYEDGGVL